MIPKVNNTKEVLAYVDRSKPVQVYRNLTKKCLSVRQSGKICCHANNVFLKDATFVVQPAGQERVRKEKKKNVHAYIKGVLCNPRECDDRLPSLWEEIYYDPYVTDGWQLSRFMNNKLFVEKAKYVDIDADETGSVVIALNLAYSN